MARGGWHGRASGGQHGFGNLGKLVRGIRVGERQAAPLAPAADCASPPAASRDVRVRCRPLIPSDVRYGLRTGHLRMPFRTSTPPTPHPCLTPTDRQLRGCRRRPLPHRETAEYGRRSSMGMSETKSSVSLHLHPSSVLSLRSTGDEDCEERYQRKSANGGGGVARSRERGGGERAQSNVGSKRQAPQLAPHPPVSVSRSYPPTYSPATRLQPPIPPHRPIHHPYPHPGIPRAAPHRARQRACLR
ncbi:hypothetical protein B0H14DRAFT_490257 [Mycena olivaceomarginata]|nr:hypothetical protein B0H14DRAFT_490257 [Mycena olivaceomarginata]